MGKHGKRVSIDKNLNLDAGTDVFSSEELLNDYLDSLGIGHTPTSTPRTTEAGEISDRLFGGSSQEEDYEDSEDAGAAIADMLMQNMGGIPRQRREKRVENTEKVQVSSAYGVTTTVKEEKTRVSLSEESSSTQGQTGVKKPHSNVCLTRYVNGVKHISLRDFAGNATSAVVRSGEMYIKPEDIDSCLGELYVYRKVTGMPAAVYDEDEFVNRMMMKGIYDVDPDRYIFMKSNNFEDMILAFTIDTDEMNQFVEYVKHSLSPEEIPDTVLALLSMMATTSVLTGDLEMANWYLATYLDENSLKDTLESDILEHVEQMKDIQVRIDFEDYDTFLTGVYGTIGGYMESVEAAKIREAEEILPGKTQEDFERFDPYKNQTPSTAVEEEGKDTGASSDVKTFPGKNDEYESNGISGDNSQTSVESLNVGESSEGINPDVSNNSQHGNSEEEKEETGVRVDGGNRGSSELEETQKEVQIGDGHPEIAEVDPENFTFEEEKEEKHSMVVDRIICGKKS